MNITNIKNNLKTATREHITHIELLTEVTSTNDLALQHAKKTPSINTAIFAQKQTHGRGQFDRTWHSPENNIYCSLTWYFKQPLNTISKLSLAIGIAMIRALKKTVSKEIKLKSPNDLFYENKKLGGILIETLTPDSQSCVAVIGIGINLVNNIPSLDQPTTSLTEITKLKQDSDIIAANMLNALSDALNQFEKNGFADFEDEWKKYEIK